MTKKKDIIDELLNNMSDVEKRRVELKMIIAAKIADAMETKSMTNKDLYFRCVDLEFPVETFTIRHWLSGTHEFTLSELIVIEEILGLKLLNI